MKNPYSLTPARGAFRAREKTFKHHILLKKTVRGWLRLSQTRNGALIPGPREETGQRKDRGAGSTAKNESPLTENGYLEERETRRTLKK